MCIHFTIRLEDEGNDKQCILVLMGATADGKKELIGITEGYRESESLRRVPEQLGRCAPSRVLSSVFVWLGVCVCWPPVL